MDGCCGGRHGQRARGPVGVPLPGRNTLRRGSRHTLRSRKKLRPCLRQRHAPGRAIQQRRFQVLFEFRYVVTDYGRRQIEPRGRSPERPQLRHALKYRHVPKVDDNCSTP